MTVDMKELQPKLASDSSCRQRQSKVSPTLPISDEKIGVKDNKPKPKPGLSTLYKSMMLTMVLTLLVFPLFQYFYLPSHNQAVETTPLAALEARKSLNYHDNAAAPISSFSGINGAFRNLASSRATASDEASKSNLLIPGELSLHPDMSVAILLQIGYYDIWDDMQMCVANVVAAAAGNFNDVDVFVSLLEDGGLQRPGSKQRVGSALSAQYIETELKKFKSVGSVYVTESRNQGADIGQFLQQVKIIHDSERVYDLILKMHTKNDDVWRERAIESLCGTPEQVVSIVRHFQSDSMLDMINPQGTTFGQKTKTDDIYPHIIRKYNVEEETFHAAFDAGMKKSMRAMHRIIFPTMQTEISEDEMFIAAGTMFWIRQSALNVPDLTNSLDAILPSMTEGYVENGAVEHVMERLFATEIVVRGRRIGEVPPAPRVLAMYFPQYQPIPENDRFWGVNFTEWTILKPLKMNGIHKPLPLSKGGLGYYDLRDREARKRQADLAREAGISGFIYYHYWFSGAHAPENHKVMYQSLENMLRDGEPNLPYALSWANEPWTKRWTGIDADTKETLLSQEYGDKSEWEEHFTYLLQFFTHPNYIKVDGGKPVFIIYRIGHIESHLEPMLALWRKMAIENGLPGIHFVNTVGNFRSIDNQTAVLEKRASIDAAFHFWPQLLGSGYLTCSWSSDISSILDFEDLKKTVHTQYWGSFTGFDRRPRDNTAGPMQRSVKEFGRGLACSFLFMANNVKREVTKNLYFVTAWNEWNEQATLEPDDKNGFGYLQQVKSKLSNMPQVLITSMGRSMAEAANQANVMKECGVCKK